MMMPTKTRFEEPFIYRTEKDTGLEGERNANASDYVQPISSLTKGSAELPHPKESEAKTSQPSIILAGDKGWAQIKFVHAGITYVALES